MKKLIICLLAIMVIAPVVHAGIPIQAPYQNAWDVEIYSNDGEDTVTRTKIVPEGVVGTGGGVLARSIMETNHPALGHFDYPAGWYCDYAEMVIDLTSVTQVNTNALPGVHAYVLLQDDPSSGGSLVAGNWDDPVRHDLGLIIPAGVSTPGIYSLDITAAMDEMIQNYTHWYMAVAFAVEGDVLGQPGSASASLLPAGESVMYNLYVPQGSPVSVGFYTEMVPEPSIMMIGLVSLLALRRKK